MQKSTDNTTNLKKKANKINEQINKQYQLTRNTKIRNKHQ